MLATGHHPFEYLTPIVVGLADLVGEAFYRRSITGGPEGRPLRARSYKAKATRRNYLDFTCIAMEQGSTCCVGMLRSNDRALGKELA